MIRRLVCWLLGHEYLEFVHKANRYRECRRCRREWTLERTGLFDGGWVERFR